MVLEDLTVEALAAALRATWRAETSNDPENWRTDNPAWGQCAVTALVVQRLFGGQLWRAEVEGVSHYWNRLSSGDPVDLTRDQFSKFEPTKQSERDRAYVLSFPDTAARYRLLLASVVERLEKSHGEGLAASLHLEHARLVHPGCA